MDDQWKRWHAHRDAARRLYRARIKRQRARECIRRLELELAVQRSHLIQAEQIVLDLWPKVPADQRGTFNDDLESLDDSPAPACAGEQVAR